MLAAAVAPQRNEPMVLAPCSASLLPSLPLPRSRLSITTKYLLIYNTKAVRRRRCPILFVRIPYRLSLDIIIRVLFVGAAVRTLPAIIFNDKSLAWTERSCACAPIYLIASLLGGSSQINIRPPKRKHFTIYRSGPPIRRQFIHPTSSDIDDA